MLRYVSANIVTGFLAHQLRPFTLDYAGRLPDIIRNTIGIIVYIPLSAWRLLARRDDLRRACIPWKYVEIVATEMLLTAVGLGAGVVGGMMMDKNKE